MNRSIGRHAMAKDWVNGEKLAAAANFAPGIASADARQPGVLGHVRIVRAGLAAYHHQTGRLDCTSHKSWRRRLRCGELSLDEDAECRPFRGGLQSLRLASWRRCLWRCELSLDEDDKSRPFREADAELADESEESSDS